MNTNAYLVAFILGIFSLSATVSGIAIPNSVVSTDTNIVYENEQSGVFAYENSSGFLKVIITE